MRIINLAENTEGAAGCGFEHGLCFYIETEHHKLLMDTGQSDLFIKKSCHLPKSIRTQRSMCRHLHLENITP